MTKTIETKSFGPLHYGNCSRHIGCESTDLACLKIRMANKEVLTQKQLWQVLCELAENAKVSK